MSSTILKIIPTDPPFVPEKIHQDEAKILLGNYYMNNEIEFETSETVEFVDQGENFESVSCNICGQIIETEFWQNEMDKAYEIQFNDLKFTTQCCHKQSSLNNLIYRWPAGFAKFTICIMQPAEGIKAEELTALQQILGVELKVIWAHY